MPRTPLVRLLRTMMAVAGESYVRNVSFEQVMQERKEKRKHAADRQEPGGPTLLGGEPPHAGQAAVSIGSASKTTLQSGTPQERRTADRGSSASEALCPRIVIVGAGLAGLTCAYRLKQAGFASLIYEADDKPAAGRVSTRYGDFDDGQIAERGGQLIDTDHRAIRRLARELGLRLIDLLAAEEKGTEPHYYFNGTAYSFTEATRDLRTIMSKLNRDLMEADFPALYNRYTQRALELDRMSVTEWIDRNVPGGKDSQLGRLLDIACNIENGAESSVQSALNLIFMHGFLSADDTFHMFGESDERFSIRGGNEQLVRRLADRIGEDRIVRGARLIAVEENAGGTYKLTFQRGASIVDVTADQVVLTLPFTVLRTSVDLRKAAFKPLKMKAIQELGMGTNSKLHLQFADRHWVPLGSNGDTVADTGYQNTFDATRAQPGKAGILVNYTGGLIGQGIGIGTAEERVRQLLRQLEPVMPGIAAKWNGKTTREYWPVNPYSLGSYSYRMVGQYTGFAGVEQEREGRKGACHFAGEHTSVEFQGYMNGAVESGERAAREIISDIGKGIRTASGAHLMIVNNQMGGCTPMDIARAKAIAASPVMENVTYQGTPIYIQYVDEHDETARIYPLDQPENEQTVPLRSLIEE